MNTTLSPQYVTNYDGKIISVILPIEDFKIIMNQLDELEDIRLYDETKRANESSVPIDEAFEMIESKRKHSEL
ncbi:MAG: hypothetical protein Q4G48_08090 [Bacteroidia bacterium]|nr:hypothetical protein [Bacteroidia bacterium]